MDASTPQTPAPAPKASGFRKENLLTGLIVGAVIAVIAGTFYWLHEQKYVFTDKAEVSAPLIQLAPQADGVLMRVYVDEGQRLSASQSVARIGDEIIRTEVPGVALVVKRDIGTMYKNGQSVVTMVDPTELQVIARIQEDKGLKDVHLGQDVIFTLDAYGSKQFRGTVDSISATKREGDVVFNISDKREEKEFDVKISYDHAMYPDLQNGMSARVWIIKNSGAAS